MCSDAKCSRGCCILEQALEKGEAGEVPSAFFLGSTAPSPRGFLKQQSELTEKQNLLCSLGSSCCSKTSSRQHPSVASVRAAAVESPCVSLYLTAAGDCSRAVQPPQLQIPCQNIVHQLCRVRSVSLGEFGVVRAPFAAQVPRDISPRFPCSR